MLIPSMMPIYFFLFPDKCQSLLGAQPKSHFFPEGQPHIHMISPFFICLMHFQCFPMCLNFWKISFNVKMVAPSTLYDHSCFKNSLIQAMNIDKKPITLVIIIISHSIIIHKGKSSLCMYAIVYLVSRHAQSTSRFISSAKNSSHHLA